MKKILAVITLLFVGLSGAMVYGQVESQWRGPNRDGVYPNESLRNAWPDDGPEEIWTVDGLGDGYSSAAVTEDRVYLTGMTKGEGFLYAFDLEGKPVWKSSYGPEWNGSRPGARTTPTVVGNRIYLMSAKGKAVCLSTDGEKIWSVDLVKQFGARNLQWGMTESLLVDGDRVFCTPGGRKVSIVALNRHTGKTIWEIEADGETSGYCSPCLIQHGKKRLLLTMTGSSVVGIDADSGKFLWRHSHVTDYSVNANTPLYHEGFIYAVSGYGTGGQMFQLSEDGTSIERVWAQKKLDSQMGAAVLVDGHIYGSGHNNRGWHCLDWKTGEVQYTARKIGNKGAIIFSDGMMYCYSETGYVGLVKPNPEEFEVVSSFRVRKGSGEHWAHPVVGDGRLYIRHGDALMVYYIGDE
jgi:outer membrane protein assembly factor BamB